MKSDTPKPRLFVPLARDPFRWFVDGRKKWELRRYGRQYTPENVPVGRRVELRLGYSTKESLWGTVVEVLLASNISVFFSKIDYKIVIPSASSREEAIETAHTILNVPLESETPVFAFKVALTE
jgi:hypothetical protein